MSTAYDTLHTHFDVFNMPDFDEISRRIQQGYASFVTAKKYQAVRALLREEIQPESLAHNPEFIQAIVSCLDEEGLLEKRNIFLSVNIKPESFV